MQINVLNILPQQFVGWDTPIDMLYACHGKVKRFSRQLQILPDYLAKNGINQAVKNDVQTILNYFNRAAQLHHQDEEENFFPTLAKYAPDAQPRIDLLESQHVSLFAVWQQLAAQLEQLLAEQRDNVDEQLIEQLVSGYAKHIELEEPLFELGKQHIPADELEAIGKLMFARRQA